MAPLTPLLPKPFTPSHPTKLSLYFWGWEVAIFRYPDFYQEEHILGSIYFIHLHVFIKHLLRLGMGLGSEGAVVIKTLISQEAIQKRKKGEK